jgi:transcriptional regulator GlxA family with amidase domain
MNRHMLWALFSVVWILSVLPTPADIANEESCAVVPAASAGQTGVDPALPTVGILVFPEVLMTEVTAPMDVFSKTNPDGKKLFNVFTIAEKPDPVATETGLRIVPDFTLSNCPQLTVLVVPSTYDMAELVRHEDLIAFIQRQNRNTGFTMSNCAGAYLMGASGIADGKKIVTYIGGGQGLKEAYPNLLVQDDQTVSFVRDGKFLSSNGNLASYISALELLEEMTSPEQRAFVESQLYLERLQNHRRRP